MCKRFRVSVQFVLFVMIMIFVTSCAQGHTYSPFCESDSGLTFCGENNGEGDIICQLQIPSRQTGPDIPIRQYIFPDLPNCEDDEAFSLVLKNAPSGLHVTIYDDPDCTQDDSTSEITVKQDVSQKVINSFEVAFSDQDVDVVLLVGGDLDDAVSCVEMYYP